MRLNGCAMLQRIIIMSPLSLQIIRGFFGTAEHAAPRLAGKFAFRLFCRTPGSRHPSAKGKRLIAQASSFMAEARIHHLTSTYGDFAAYEFSAWGARRDGPVALVLHGWRSRTEHMRQVIEALLRRGFRVVALDFPGHGRSSGRLLHMPNAVAAVHTAALWFGPFAVAVGHSFGGAVALNAAAGSVRHIPAVIFERLVLIASPDSMPQLFADFGRFVGLGRRVQATFESEVAKISGRPLDSFVGSRQLAELTIPTLVIHAPDDKEVAPHSAEVLAGAGPHVTLEWAPGLGHRRILADASIAERAAEFGAEAAKKQEMAFLH